MTEEPVRDVVIIGSGFSGLCAAIKLRESGVTDIVILEEEHEVGGTWRDNTYPGCACDIPSVLYSFSFLPNPEWTRLYPAWNEILDYLLVVADRFDLRRLIEFGQRVDSARFDPVLGVWQVETATGRSIRARWVISGTGILDKPRLPDIPGIDTFEGISFHSARWEHRHDLSRARVAVIGTGASAIQFVPHLVASARQVDVYQRTAQWVMPRGDRSITAAERARSRRLPILQRAQRWRTYWEFERLATGFLGHPKVVERYRREAMRFLDRAVPDVDLRRRLTPDFMPGCKRRLVSDDWYPALQQPNCTLVTDPIARIEPSGIRTEDGQLREVDVIVFGTGYAATDFLAPMRVYGDAGQELSEAWRDGAKTRLGITTSGFPNFFLLLGPNTTLGHNSMVFMIEAQCRYIAGLLKVARRRGIDVVDLRPQVQERYYADIQRRMSRTVWVTGCRSWYQSADGRIDTLWPRTTIAYWWLTRKIGLDDYRTSSRRSLARNVPGRNATTGDVPM